MGVWTCYGRFYLFSLRNILFKPSNAKTITNYLTAHLCLCYSSTNQDFHEKFGLRFKGWAVKTLVSCFCFILFIQSSSPAKAAIRHPIVILCSLVYMSFISANKTAEKHVAFFPSSTMFTCVTLFSRMNLGGLVHSMQGQQLMGRSGLVQLKPDFTRDSLVVLLPSAKFPWKKKALTAKQNTQCHHYLCNELTDNANGLAV